MHLSLEHQKHCITRPIIPSMMGGCFFTAWDLVTSGGALSMPAVPGRLLTYMSGIYVYNIIQCPMEAVHGRTSAWHNVMAGGMLGYIGVSRQLLGVPFVDPTFFYRYPQISPALGGFAVYGAMGGVLAMMSGKPF